MADSSSVNMVESIGTISGSGDMLTVTPSHGLLSRRVYTFDRNRQTVTIADKKWFIMGSKKSHPFEQLSLRLGRYGQQADQCVELECRIPGKPLLVYRLTDTTDDHGKIESILQAVSDATGIERWADR